MPSRWGPVVFDVRAAVAVGSAPRPSAFYVPQPNHPGSPPHSRHKKPRPARPRGASPGRATCGAASPLPSARRPPGARRRRGSASSSGRPWRPWFVLCSQPATGLPPPVGLPPQRGRGSHECRAHECSPLGRAIRRALCALPIFGARRSMQRWRLAAPRPARASTASGPGGRGWPEYWLGSDARSRERRRRHRRDPTTGETGTKLLIAS